MAPVSDPIRSAFCEPTSTVNSLASSDRPLATPVTGASSDMRAAASVGRLMAIAGNTPARDAGVGMARLRIGTLTVISPTSVKISLVLSPLWEVNAIASDATSGRPE